MGAKILKKKKLNPGKSKPKAPRKAAPAKSAGRKAAAKGHAASKIVRILKIAEDPRVKVAREQYEAGVGLLTSQKYEKAVALFEKVLLGPSAELSERARMHLSICRQRIERRVPAIKTAEEHYNYAVVQSNAGKLADAEEHLHKAMKLSPRAGHLHYALAAVLAQQGQIEAALGNLKQAIDLDGHNRFLARSDADFNPLYEDPRYADLIYPDRMD